MGGGLTVIHSEPVWSQNLQFLVTVIRHYDLTVKYTHRHQRVVIAVVQAMLAKGKQSERLNQAAQQRKKSNSNVDIYNEIVFSPLLCRLTSVYAFQCLNIYCVNQQRDNAFMMDDF